MDVLVEKKSEKSCPSYGLELMSLKAHTVRNEHPFLSPISFGLSIEECN